ncbi:MAG: aquaporin family protein [Chloroflexota bacterium]|nr:aquaporin family protein [Chloroflexota bacterium]
MQTEDTGRDWGTILSRAMLRRYAAEFLGTFALVFFGCGARAMVGDTNDFAGILLIHITFGFTIAAMIYALTPISAAFFNPAITLGLATVRRFPWRYTVPYWISQFAGAILASTFHFILFPAKAAAVHYGATIPKVDVFSALLLEFVLTFFLMLVTMAMATDRRANRPAAGLTVGFTVIICGLFANHLTGGSMNPARSLGPALFGGPEALGSLWIYFLSPAVAAVAAALVYELIRGGEEKAKEAADDLPVQANGLQQATREGVTALKSAR